MFSKTFTAVLLLAITVHVRAHGIISPALGVSGTPVRAEAKRLSASDVCGPSSKVATDIDSATPVVAAADGSFNVVATSFDKGLDGSRQVTAAVDPTGKGASFTAIKVTKNGNLKPTVPGSQPVVAVLPAGTKCTGGAAGNLCLVQFKTASGFGSCVAVSQGNVSVQKVKRHHKKGKKGKKAKKAKTAAAAPADASAAAPVDPSDVIPPTPIGAARRTFDDEADEIFQRHHKKAKKVKKVKKVKGGAAAPAPEAAVDPSNVIPPTPIGAARRAPQDGAASAAEPSADPAADDPAAAKKGKKHHKKGKKAKKAKAAAAAAGAGADAGGAAGADAPVDPSKVFPPTPIGAARRSENNAVADSAAALSSAGSGVVAAFKSRSSASGTRAARALLAELVAAAK